jgi:hypothetical protein
MTAPRPLVIKRHLRSRNSSVPGIVAVTALAALLGWAPVASAQDTAAAKVADPRVAADLKTTGLAYSIDGGDYRLKYDLDGGRSQLVWVASSTATLDKLEIRDVWSVAYRAKGQLPQDMALRLLTENARMILGAWQVNQGKDEYLVVFSAPVSATADASTLEEVIEVVTLSADRIEKELTGKDEF